jgi:hypothetical protein
MFILCGFGLVWFGLGVISFAAKRDTIHSEAG